MNIIQSLQQNVFTENRSKSKRDSKEVFLKGWRITEREDWIVAEHKREAVEKEERKESRFEKKN